MVRWWWEERDNRMSHSAFLFVLFLLLILESKQKLGQGCSPFSPQQCSFKTAPPGSESCESLAGSQSQRLQVTFPAHGHWWRLPLAAQKLVTEVIVGSRPLPLAVTFSSSTQTHCLFISHYRWFHIFIQTCLPTSQQQHLGKAYRRKGVITAPSMHIWIPESRTP